MDQQPSNRKRQSRRRRKPSSRDCPEASASSAANQLLRVVDLALLALIFVAPYFMGGRHPVGRFVIVLLIVVAACAWFARQCLLRDGVWIRSAADWLVPAAVLVVSLQLVPLPSGLLATISPQLADKLPLWSADAGPARLGTWSTISVAPAATLGGLSMLAAYGLLLWVVVQRLRRLRDIERCLCCIAAAAVLMAAFGLVQRFTSNGKFIWIYEDPYRVTSDVVKGPFINQNHFTQMLALGMGPLLFWIVRTLQGLGNDSFRSHGRLHNRDSAVRFLIALVIGLFVVALASLLSFSRGGAVAVALAGVVAGAILLRAKVVSLRLFLWGATSVTLLLGVALAIHGYERVTSRLDDLTSGSVDELDSHRGRRNIWEANLAAFREAPLAGSGVGSHAEVYPIYLPNPPKTEYTHAESGYFQISTETGFLGIALLLTAIGVIGWKCVGTFRHARSRRVQACLAAVASGLVASVVHSTVDFVWYIPACAILTLILIGCALRLRDFADAPPVTKQKIISRPVWIGATAVVVLIGVGAVHNRLGPARGARYWDAYLRQSVLAANELKRSLAENEDGLAALSSAEQTERESEMIRQLLQTLKHDPTHARAHLRLAAHLLNRFNHSQEASENQMEVRDIRDAAIRSMSSFTNRQKLDEWLARSVGDHRILLDKALWHARRGLKLCPYQGEGYIYLARLCFLDLQGKVEKSAYVDQALRLRRYDGDVLFEAGYEADFAGDCAGRNKLWKECFHTGHENRVILLLLLKDKATLKEILVVFEPELEDLPQVYRQYRDMASEEDLVELCRYHKKLIARKETQIGPEAAARSWLFASQLNRRLKRWDELVACAQLAVKQAPYDFEARRTLAEALLHTRQFDEAKQQILWCIKRRPKMKRLEQLLARANGHIAYEEEVETNQPIPRSAAQHSLKR